MRIKERNVKGRFARWMRKPRKPNDPESRGWTAFIRPGIFYDAVIYYWLLDNETGPHLATIIHEKVGHGDQIARYGRVGYAVRYLWLWARGGFKYRSHPMEIEAREAAGQE